MISSTSSATATSWPERPGPVLPATEAPRTGPDAVLDLRTCGNHPLGLRYSEIHSQAVLDGRIDHGRAQPGLEVGRTTPFLFAARRALAHGLHRPGVLEAMLECLQPYYCRVRPRHAADWLGLGDSAHPTLQAAPPWAAVFPWRARTVESYRAAYEQAALAENRAVGREVGIEDGWLFCGPVSQAKMQIEAERILYVLRRIAEHGYQRHDGPDGDVRATALVDDNGGWRWLITAGNHRASAAAALGMSSIPVRVNLVISRADVRHWRGVGAGLYSVPQALAVFDRYFDARPPAVVHRWLANAMAT